MKKITLVIGMIWTILTVMCIAIITSYDSTNSTTSEINDAVVSIILFQFFPSMFVTTYYLKKKSVPKISYVLLGLLYTWLFFVLGFMSQFEQSLIYLIILFIVPSVGFIIWIKSKLNRNMATKNNHIKNKTKTEKDNNYDRLKNEISEYQLKKEISEYPLKNDDEHTRKILELRSKETESKETESKEEKHAKKGIAVLLKLPESEILEFKSTLKWDIRQEKSNPELVVMCVKTIAGFLNNRGGILIVGYDDDNNIVYGLEKDYPFTSKKCNYDGWQQYFINQINDKLGKTINHYFTIESVPYNGKTLAKINVKPSPEPVFTKQDGNEGNFYVRIHGQTENLNPQETQKWISSHFKK